MAEERVQRKLTTILAADVEGYSRLMSADEEATLKTLKTYREIIDGLISRHGGRIFGAAGDSVVIEFGSAVEAVRCAIAIQEELRVRNAELIEDRRMRFRIGVNVGDVMVEDDNLFGDGINVAARLEGLAEAGGVCISGSVFEQVKNKLSIGFEDIGAQEVKNIPEPVQCYRVRLEPNGTKEASPPLSDRPAVAVLPFENMSGDPEQEYFADGLTEDIITALSLWRSFPVIARNSTFAYKGKSPDIREVGETLGARYVLEGSVRKSGNRIRVTLQMIDADTGHHLQSDRFDRDLDDIFALQDEIAARVAGIVVPEVDRAEQRRLQTRNPANLGAWEFYQRGLSQAEEMTKEDNVVAREMFAKAIALDPSYARAYASLALTHHFDLYMEFTDSRADSLAEMQEAAHKAVAIDGADAAAHAVSSRAAVWVGDYERAISDAQRSLQLNPSGVDGNIALAAALDFSGRSHDAIPYYERVLQLSPLYPHTYVFRTMLARAQVNIGEYEAAIDSSKQAIETRPSYLEAHMVLAAALARLDRGPEAADAYRNARELRPQGGGLPESWTRYGVPSGSQPLVEGLRKAGWEG